MDKIRIGRAKNNGREILANDSIRKNEKIFSFRGRTVKFPYDSNYKLGGKWVGVGKNIWLKTAKGSYGSFINHSCKPNAGFRGKLSIVAMRNIRKGEEITFDYSISEEDPYWRMKCRCGERICRKTIRRITSLPRGTFRKYGDYIPKYFKYLY